MTNHIPECDCPECEMKPIALSTCGECGQPNLAPNDHHDINDCAAWITGRADAVRTMAGVVTYDGLRQRIVEMQRWASQLGNEVIEQRQRIAELEDISGNLTAQMFEQMARAEAAEKRIEELEAKKVRLYQLFREKAEQADAAEGRERRLKSALADILAMEALKPSQEQLVAIYRLATNALAETEASDDSQT